MYAPLGKWWRRSSGLHSFLSIEGRRMRDRRVLDAVLTADDAMFFGGAVVVVVLLLLLLQWRGEGGREGRGRGYHAAALLSLSGGQKTGGKEE